MSRRGSKCVSCCIPGPAGPAGQNGLPGNPGQPGTPGQNGKNGKDGTNGCCQIGRKIVPLSILGSTVVTENELLNPSVPGATYKILKFTGGEDEGVADVVLPLPASEDFSDMLVLENWSDGCTLRFWAGSVGVGETFELLSKRNSEETLEAEIQDNAENIKTYRTWAEINPGGVFRTPGFAGTAI